MRGRGGENSRPEPEVTRVQLPSGKNILLYNYVSLEPTGDKQTHAPLCTCPACGHDRVQPTGWSGVGQTHWHVTLRCPDCEDRREGIFSQSELDDFDSALDEGTHLLKADLDLLSRANMAVYVENFTNALQAGAIIPEDF